MFRRKRSDIVPLEGLIYAVGDIHGRLDLLLRATELIVEHAAGRSHRMLFLGDYVDRGPDSRGVVEHLMAAERAGAVCLRGNHEQMMVAACRDDGGLAVKRWLDNGGFPALRSYGAARPTELNRIPTAHVDWLARLPLLARDAHRIYVHAGLMPGQSLEKQREETLLWVRERFLRVGPEALPAHVVHGHTPEWAGKPAPAEPELRPHRTNLDTGAFFTDVLAVGVFDAAVPGGPLEVLTAHSHPDR
jgi:serine/threonine protein phosphatase 1